MKKLVALVLILILSMGILTAGTASAEAGKKYRVALIVKSLSEAYATWLADSVLNQAKSHEEFSNLEITVFDSMADASKCIDNVEMAVTQQFDLILIQKTGGFDTNELFTRVVKEDGIPIVTLNITVTDEVSCNVAASNYDLGFTEGTYAASLLPEGANILIIRGTVGDLETERFTGMSDALLKTRTDLKILDEQIATYNRAEALALMEDWLQKYDQIDAVVSMNDGMALGAIEACLADPDFDISKCLFFGVDGLGDGCVSIYNGYLTASVMQDAEEMAYQGLVMCEKVLRGEVEGKEDFYIDSVLITKDNVNEYIDRHIKNGILDAKEMAKIGYEYAG